MGQKNKEWYTIIMIIRELCTALCLLNFFLYYLNLFSFPLLNFLPAVLNNEEGKLFMPRKKKKKKEEKERNWYQLCLCSHAQKCHYNFYLLYTSAEPCFVASKFSPFVRSKFDSEATDVRVFFSF